MNASALKAALCEGVFEAQLTALYGADSLAAQTERYLAAIDAFVAQFGDRDDLCLFSVPGRTEVSGNHTDHNRGKVLAAAVDLDILAVCARREDTKITVASAGYPIDSISYDRREVVESERFTSRAILRGTCDAFARRGM